MPDRPVFHFAPPADPMNDPNGLIYHKGEWHLFYQRNWGKAWGHAISPDLFRWTDLPNALEQDAAGNVASGSAVLDSANTSGFGQDGQPPLVAAYTAWDDHVQCIAHSLDDGRTWAKFPGNPVVPYQHRDPKLLWHEATARWVMVIYDTDGFTFFSSPDLKHWSRESHIANDFFECCDLFELPVDGRGGESRWILVSGDLAYQTGEFDGHTFTPDGPVLRGDWGNPSFADIRHIFHSRHLQCQIYASQTWSQVPAEDGRRIQISWMPQSNGVCQTGTATGHMSVPVELSLVATPSGPRLRRLPVRELASLRGDAFVVPPGRIANVWTPNRLEGDANPLEAFFADAFDLELTILPGDAVEIGLQLNGLRISVAPQSGTLICQGKSMPIRSNRADTFDGFEDAITLRILRDRYSVEIFAADGRYSMTQTTPPACSPATNELFALGGTAEIHRLMLYPILPEAAARKDAPCG